MEGVIVNEFLEFNYPDVPDVAANTLGKKAVLMATRAAAEAAAFESADHGLVRLEQADGGFKVIDASVLGWNIVERRRAINREIMDAQADIAQLDDNKVAVLDTFCEHSIAPELQAAKERAGFNGSWAEWLSGTSPRNLMKFFRWNIEAVRRLAVDPEVDHAFESQRQDYKRKIRQAVKEGWLHPDARDALVRVESVKFYVGDIFDTRLQGISAYHITNTNIVVIGCGGKILPDNNNHEILGMIKRTGDHELNHVIGRLPWRWLNEAVTEHIAQSLQHGRVEVVDPDRRNNSYPPFYKPERKLLDYILHEGSESVPARLATEAYSEGAESLKVWREFTAAVDHAWASQTHYGYDTFELFNCYVDQMELQYRQRGMSEIKAGAEAASQVLRDIRYQPEVIFGGQPGLPQVAFSTQSIS